MVVAMDALSSTVPAVVLLTSLLFISTLPRCRPLSFSYNFSVPATFDLSNITTEGTATLFPQDDGRIELTQNPDPKTEGIFNTMGRASYSKPVLLWDKATGEVTSFTTRFSFAIKGGGTKGRYAPGDGIAFFLSPYPSIIPPKDGGGGPGGGYLGLFVNKSTAATPVVVAVEFDTFRNDWDWSTDHIGIDVNSVNSTAVEVLPNGTLANCREPMIALVSYNSTTRLLAVALQLDIIDGGMRYEMNSTVDLKSLLPAEVAIGFSAASGWSIDLHRVLTWSFNSTLVETVPVVVEEPKGDEGAPNKAVQTFPSKGMVLPVAGAAGAVFTVACVGSLIWFLMMRRRRRTSGEQEHEMEDLEISSMDDEFESGTCPRRFSYGELAAATNHFSEDGKLGEGGFGSVYRGSLSDMGLEVAVKRISKSSQQGRKEYVSEVTIISRLRHRNLVELVGWCHRSGEFLLVYELVPNGSLEAHLYGSGKALTWPSRYEIVLGLGSALLYLHEQCKKCVVHRDVKPSNVMLDASFGAKLGDFGLAKLLDHGSSLETAFLAGTMGYMDPEYAATGRASTPSDVYSFGIVLLEICCGRRPRLPRDESIKSSLLEWVWDLYGREETLEAADKRLDGDFDDTQIQRVLVVGLWCAHPDRSARPSIKQALGVLQFEAPLPPLPPTMPVPTYTTSVAGSCSGDSSSAGVLSSSGGELWTTTSSSTTPLVGHPTVLLAPAAT